MLMVLLRSPNHMRGQARLQGRILLLSMLRQTDLQWTGQVRLHKRTNAHFKLSVLCGILFV
jgi:hypothetical protein